MQPLYENPQLLPEMNSDELDDSAGYNESDCCGNGCVHCVLDMGLKKSPALSLIGKRNVISNYRKFKLLGKHSHRSNSCNVTVEESLFDVLELHLVCVDLPEATNADILDIPPGHHVMLRAHLLTGDVCLRPYSPFWVDTLAMEFKILVNLRPNGPMSRFIDELQVDDEVEVRGPIGTYMYKAFSAETRCICIVSQGVAITSTLRIVEEILNNEDEIGRVQHLCCFSDLTHMYFRDVTHGFSKYWNYKCHTYLAHQQCDDDACNAKESNVCKGLCSSFKKSLRYKESVFPRRLTVTDLRNYCSFTPDVGENIFIIAGTKIFQNSIVDMIETAELVVKEENIILL